MVYPRTIYPHILEHAKTPLVTVLTGMRRTGKTTLVKKLLTDLSNKNALFFDLQRADIRELFRQKNYDALREAFIERGLSSEIPMVIALDEIQLVPEIPEIIKYLYDHYGIKFIVTGSSSYYLKHLFTESLAGRKKVFELFPLDFGEYLTFKDVYHKDIDSWNQDFNLDEYRRLSGYYEEYIRFGGFP
jgi:predicted AAA+ superfamily ATPase